MKEKLAKLKALIHEFTDLEHVESVLSWDRETKMPEAAGEARGYQTATIAKIAHQKFTSDEIGKLIEDLTPYADQLDPDSDDARLIKVVARKFDKEIKVPADMVAEKAELSSASYMAWVKARAENNFDAVIPYLEKHLDWNLRYSELFKPFEHPYDPLLDEYEPDMKTSDVKAIFDEVRPKQVALLEAIAAQPEIDDAIVTQKIPVQKQDEAGMVVLNAIGYDWTRGRMDETHHPFSSTLGYGDNRITVHYNEDNFFNAFLFSAMHEAGHAMYEQGIAKSLARTPLYDGASLTIHESQSRLWENLVGHSEAFIDWYFPQLQNFFPAQFGNTTAAQLYRGVNKVKPSLIRIEADEATYNMHVMIRFSLETQMIEGKIAIKDLPDAWNSGYEDYLGITPPNNKDGVMQDVHWYQGYFGYFSTYALGNLVSAQLWEQMLEDHPNVNDEMRKGDFSNIHSWMKDKIYQHGAKFKPQEMVEKITGSKINGDAYIRYLQNKFGSLYQL